MSHYEKKDIVHHLLTGQQSTECVGLTGSSKAFFANKICKETGKPLLIVVSSTKDAEKMLSDLMFFSKPVEIPISYFPPYPNSPYRALPYHNEIAAKRIEVLYRVLDEKKPYVIVTTIGAMLQKIIPKQALVHYAELLICGEEIDRDLLIEKLVSGGYTRSIMVEEPGDFSIRGGILDVFSPLYSEPLRIEFFGDTVDTIRFFSAVSQRKLNDVPEAVILPARETILEKQKMTQIVSRVRELASEQSIPVTKIREFVDRIKREGVFAGIEGLMPLFYDSLHTIIDYLPSQGLFVLVETTDLENEAEKIWAQALRYFDEAKNESRLCLEPEALYMDWTTALVKFEQRKPLTFNSLPISTGREFSPSSPKPYVFAVRDNSDVTAELQRFQEKDTLLLPLANWIQDRMQHNCAPFLICSTDAQAERLEALLSPYGIIAEQAKEFDDMKYYGKGVSLCIGQLSSGFTWAAESVAIITEDEIFGVKHHRRRVGAPKVHSELLSFEDLKIEDFIVHVEHGIGRYKGLEKLKIDGTTNDFILMVYKGGDKLYLPVDRMNMVQKYVGVDSLVPVLDKLGGVSWDRIKRKVKKSTEKIAGELLKLYAARKVEQGHAFERGDSYFREFEAGFPYEETADQLNAIEDVLEDMEQPLPMDRLICGDVGYGKTEIALRASFIAVNEGKQVAVLVPTTILAEQHHANFSQRFSRYPVRIECLSRFRSDAEQRKIIKDLKSGIVDIVIGTHRLLQKDVAFKDLGLVVLDEEQRFGVKDKEKLKTLRQTVDVLALTATPIPRTLHMSLLGVRDISVISTPPEHRRAIITYISEFDEAIIVQAIQNELDRQGQIFFVHNNILSIWALARRLKELVPQVRLGVAHGRLKEETLERVMLQFINKEIDMLVCTTIIESGLDIPAANTMLINRADKFGLAQMYQLRGRIGRAEEQAYAYLFIPRHTKLTKNAQKRMKVLMEHSDLGSGFQIAMSDLNIRGGGSILGDEQSGHIAAVGYDMFLKLMAESMAELKGEPVCEALEPEINVMMSAYIPETYIADIDHRLMIYRRLARMLALEEIADFKEELLDRFGPLPGEATNLLLKIMLKVLSIKAGVKRLDLTGSLLMIHFSQAHLRNPFGFMDMIANEKNGFEFTTDHVLKAKLRPGRNEYLLAQTRNILKEIAQRVNN